MKFDIIMLVFGAEYTRTFLDVALPMMLSAGNLPAVAAESQGSTFRFFTTQKDFAAIQASPLFPILNSMLRIEVSIVKESDIKAHRKYGVMTSVHRNAIVQANETDTPLIFLGPDAIVPDGVLARTVEIAKSGKRALMASSYRMTKETYVPAMLEKFPRQKDGSIVVPKRDCVALSLNNLHPISEAFLWDSDNYHRHPAHLYWPVKGTAEPNAEGLLCRCFHIHPLMMWPQRKDVTPPSTIDGKFIAEACPNYDDIYVVEDSDDIFIPEITSLSDHGLMKALLPNGSKVMQFLQINSRLDNALQMKTLVMANWAQRATDKYHRRYIGYKVRNHTGHMTPALWAKAERESDEVVSQINLWMAGNTYQIMLDGLNCPVNLLDVLRNTEPEAEPQASLKSASVGIRKADDPTDAEGQTGIVLEHTVAATYDRVTK